MARLQFLTHGEVRPTLEAHFPVKMTLDIPVSQVRELWDWAGERYGYNSAITVLKMDQHPRNYVFDPNRKFAAWLNVVYFMDDTEAMFFKMSFG